MFYIRRPSPLTFLSSQLSAIKKIMFSLFLLLL